MVVCLPCFVGLARKILQVVDARNVDSRKMDYRN